GILTEAERARLTAQYDGVQVPLVEAPVQPIHTVMPPIAGGSNAADQLPMVQSNGNGTHDASAYRGPRVQADAPTCASCGWIMSRSGTCYRCENCGSTSGCS